jgi:hypothetical protein
VIVAPDLRIRNARCRRRRLPDALAEIGVEEGRSAAIGVAALRCRAKPARASDGRARLAAKPRPVRAAFRRRRPSVLSLN